MGQDTALAVGVELVLDEPRQLRSCAGLGVGDEVVRVLPHQAVQLCLLGAVAFVVERGAIGHPMGLLRRALHDGLPVRRARTVSGRAPCLNCIDCCPPTCALRRGASYG